MNSKRLVPATAAILVGLTLHIFAGESLVYFGTYTEEKFFDDMGRVTEYRTDPDLCEILVTRSKATMLWMREKGMRFMPI